MYLRVAGNNGGNNVSDRRMREKIRMASADARARNFVARCHEIPAAECNFEAWPRNRPSAPKDAFCGDLQAHSLVASRCLTNLSRLRRLAMGRPKIPMRRAARHRVRSGGWRAAFARRVRFPSRNHTTESPAAIAPRMGEVCALSFLYFHSECCSVRSKEYPIPRQKAILTHGAERLLNLYGDRLTTDGRFDR